MIGRARISWWTWPGSNRRPPACKAGALPAELHAPNNYMTPIMILIEFRENDYLLCLQVLSKLICQPITCNLHCVRYLQRFPEQL